MQYSNQDCKDILTTAVESGTDYWAYSADVQRDTTTHAVDRVTFVDATDEAAFLPVTVRWGQVLPAMQAVLDQYPKTRAAAQIRTNDPGMIDAEGADVIAQVAAFGEIVFG